MVSPNSAAVWAPSVSLNWLPPAISPYDIETMEPLALPLQWGWADEAELPPAEWWTGGELAWEPPELGLDEGWLLVLDGDPDPGDEWPVFPAD